MSFVFVFSLYLQSSQVFLKKQKKLDNEGKERQGEARRRKERVLIQPTFFFFLTFPLLVLKHVIYGFALSGNCLACCMSSGD